MPTSTQLIKTLRTTTGAGIMACKKALQEANGDLQKAQDLLRKKSLSISAKRADRDTTHGLVFTATDRPQSTGVLFTLRCETDFVATTAAFDQLGKTIAEAAIDQQPATLDALQKITINGVSVADTITAAIGQIGEKITLSDYAILKGACIVEYRHFDKSLGVLLKLNRMPNGNIVYAGKVVAMQIAAMNPAYISAADIPEAAMEKARQEKNWEKEVTLLAQPFIKDNKITVKQHLANVHADLKVTAFKRVQI